MLWGLIRYHNIEHQAVINPTMEDTTYGQLMRPATASIIEPSDIIMSGKVHEISQIETVSNRWQQTVSHKMLSFGLTDGDDFVC